MISLNSKERKTLYALSKDARTSGTRLAKRAGISKDIAHYNIKKFQRMGLVKRFITVINAERLGFTRYELYLQLRSREAEAEIVRYLSQHGSFIWVISSLGNWDILTEFCARDALEYARIMTEVKNRFHNAIKDASSAVVTAEYSFPLKCLGYMDEEVFKAAPGSVIQIDDKDKAILRLLAQDARISVVEIARQVGLGSDAVIYRMRKLQEQSVILGYRLVLDEQSLGLGRFKILLKLNAIDEKVFSKLLTCLKSDGSIQYLKRCIGQWDLSITMLAHNLKELRARVGDITSQMDTALDEYSILFLFTEYKNTYLPHLESSRSVK